MSRPAIKPFHTSAGRAVRAGFVAAALLLLGACGRFSRVVTPQAYPADRQAALQAEGVYRAPIEKRALPDLSAEAPLPRVLEYGLNASGEVEGAYREWRAALERVPQAGALPDPKFEFKLMFGPDNFASFSNALDAVTLMLSQDMPAQGKREGRAEQALAEARASGERFRGAVFEQRKKIIQAYADLTLNRALLGQTSDTLRLLGQSREVALHRYHEGAETVLADVRKMDVEIQKVESEQRQLQLKEAGLAGALNGALNRKADAPVGRAALPEAEPPARSDAELFALAVKNNPELAALRREVEARGAAQVLAELERRPDYTLKGGLEGLANPTLGAEIMLPLNRERIRAAIDEALAMRQAAEAKVRAGEFDTQARLVMALASLRDAARILGDYEREIIPSTKELLDAQMSSYGSGGGEVLDILDTERMLVDFRKMMLQAESDRLRALAEVEAATGEVLVGGARTTSSAAATEKK